MSFLCPVCNGLTQVEVRCTQCGGPAEDQGRFNDYLGPYSPYRSIDDISATNGFPDRILRECVHVFSCATCCQTLLFSIAQWSEEQLAAAAYPLHTDSASPISEQPEHT